jgi:hypothetical protein
MSDHKLPSQRASKIDLVTRSIVPKGKKYPAYRSYLRHDFFHSCAYCTMSEYEAHGIRFTIDHYEPRNARPDLEHEYENLMYSCDECNIRKGDRWPPPEARKDDHRFFRPDQDVRREHFDKGGVRLNPRTNVGVYSIHALDLNRLSLRRLREIRDRLSACTRLAEEGIMGLRRLPIDRMPPDIKGKVLSAINRAVSAEAVITGEIDSVLRQHARSPLLDPDPDADAHATERIARLRQMEALYPGKWRAPRGKRR